MNVHSRAILACLLFAAGISGTGDSARAPVYGAPTVIAHLENSDVDESSGIVASRRNPGLFWTHNDSGGAPLLYLFDRKGRDLGTWRVRGATATDWEDIAIGPGPVRGRSYLYIGDIGDNRRSRREVVVFRVEEPAAGRPGATSETQMSAPLRFRYSDAPHDAEALAVHPHTGDIYIIVKARGEETRTSVYRARAPHRTGSVTTFKLLGDVNLPAESELVLLIGRATGADISPDGRRVVICDYLRAYEAVLPTNAGFDAIWRQPFTALSLGPRKQGEAVCYRLDGRALLATSEGRPCPLIETVRNAR